MLNTVDGVLGQVHQATTIVEVLNVECQVVIDIAITSDFEALIIAERFEE